MPANYEIDLNKLQRVNVIGTSGSGKSTFSKKLAAILQSDYVETDGLYFKPNWQIEPDEVFFAKLEVALSKPRWVHDGNYNRTLNIKWKNVQTVIWLDYSFPLVMWRIVKRSVHRVIAGNELWGTGNYETLSKLFSKDSIVLWSYQTYDLNKQRYNEMMQDEQYKHINFIRLQNRSEAQRFLTMLENKNAGHPLFKKETPR